MLAVVIVGYNRLFSLKRTFESVDAAYYPKDCNIDLIISLDYSGNDSIREYVNSISWVHGKKRIRVFEQNQGLRKHILSCGDFLKEYDALIVLEDDIVVAEDFINYAIQAVEFYKDDDSIAGVSLYSHALCQQTLYRFQPMKTIYDVYFMKYAASWGQIWIKAQFLDFLEWYGKQSDESIKQIDIPDMVKNWPQSSWLKFHIAYCSDKNKYYVYPYSALSTDYSEAGEHYSKRSNVFQVELQKGTNKVYNFCHGTDKAVAKYDSFFENEELYGVLDKYPDICLNINGIRTNISAKYNYCLSTSKINKRIIKEYGLVLRPIEENIIKDIPGRGIAIYDLHHEERNKVYREQQYLLWAYSARGHSLPHYLLSYVLYKIKNRILEH